VAQRYTRRAVRLTLDSMLLTGRFWLRGWPRRLKRSGLPSTTMTIAPNSAHGNPSNLGLVPVPALSLPFLDGARRRTRRRQTVRSSNTGHSIKVHQGRLHEEISETCRVGIDDGLQELIEVIDDGFSENCPVTTTWVSEVALLEPNQASTGTSSSGNRR
jgi:hypothetical protein